MLTLEEVRAALEAAEAGVQTDFHGQGGNICKGLEELIVLKEAEARRPAPPAPGLSWATYALLQDARWLLSNVEKHHANREVRETIMEARNQLAAIRNALLEATDLLAAEGFFGPAKVADIIHRIGRWAKASDKLAGAKA